MSTPMQTLEVGESFRFEFEDRSDVPYTWVMQSVSAMLKVLEPA